MSRQFARNSNILKAKIDNVLPNLNVLEEYSECLGKIWPPFVMASFLALSRRKRAGKRSGGEKVFRVFFNVSMFQILIILDN
ncbi:13807_t:CDS:2 [Funneliformis geosporum]|nr:13807_t:CDS:2 [Funneliformis geosporum]